jgi:predicted MFS family arabinose efflux permease
MVFAVGSMGQLVVGRLLDNLGPRVVFMTVAAMQVVFFALMPGLTGWAAVAVALAFMLGAFGQIPINDYMIGRMATPERRASIYGVRFVVTFAVLGAALPFISWVHKLYGFDTLFRILSVCAAIVLAAAAMLPSRLPATARPSPAAAE